LLAVVQSAFEAVRQVIFAAQLLAVKAHPLVEVQSVSTLGYYTQPLLQVLSAETSVQVH